MDFGDGNTSGSLIKVSFNDNTNSCIRLFTMIAFFILQTRSYHDNILIYF